MLKNMPVLISEIFWDLPYIASKLRESLSSGKTDPTFNFAIYYASLTNYSTYSGPVFSWAKWEKLELICYLFISKPLIRVIMQQYFIKIASHLLAYFKKKKCIQGSLNLLGVMILKWHLGSFLFLLTCERQISHKYINNYM